MNRDVRTFSIDLQYLIDLQQEEWEMTSGKHSKAHFVWKCGNCTYLLRHITILN